MTLARRAAFSLVLVLGSGSGCSAGPSDPPSRVVHVEGKGPLSAEPGSIGQLTAPADDEWWGSFGGFVLCTRHGTKSVVLDEVRVAADESLSGSAVWVRTIKPLTVQEDVDLVFFSARGRPPGFEEPYASYKPAGEMRGEVKGLVVDTTCRDLDPLGGLHEVIITAKAGRHGGTFRELEIDYRAGTTTYTLRIPLALTLCNQEIPLLPGCARQKKKGAIG